MSSIISVPHLDVKFIVNAEIMHNEFAARQFLMSVMINGTGFSAFDPGISFDEYNFVNNVTGADIRMFSDEDATHLDELLAAAFITLEDLYAEVAEMKRFMTGYFIS